MAKKYQGKFKPKNPQKYRGNPTNIVYRSGWELKFMAFLDSHDSVIEWASEELAIPYWCGVRRSRHRYFPDFWVRKRNKDGLIETMLVEIKPEKQTKPPNRNMKNKPRLVFEEAVYRVNKSKWAAAKEYCENRGWKFMILTEKELGITYGKN